MDLCVPLADEAVKILRRVERRPDRDSVFGHAKRHGLSLSSLRSKIDTRIKRAGGTPPQSWRIHDIRRTVRTKLAELGVTADVAEALIGHVGHRTQMDRTYNRYKYWPEMRQALKKWEIELRAIIDSTAKKIEYPRFDERKIGDTA